MKQGIEKEQWTIVDDGLQLIKTPKKQEITGGDRCLQDAFRHLHFQWIGFDEMIHRLAQLLTCKIHYGGDAAVVRMLRRGLVAYAAELESPEHLFPHQRLKTFLRACLQEALVVCKFEVVDDLDGERWTLQNDLPLSLWRMNSKNLIVQADSQPASEFLAALYDRAIPENFKRVMRRFGHEATVLACHLDSYI